MAVTPLKPETATGVDELVFVPLPSWPLELYPQHSTVPFISCAQVSLPFAATDFTAGWEQSESLLAMQPVGQQPSPDVQLVMVEQDHSEAAVQQRKPTSPAIDSRVYDSL